MMPFKQLMLVVCLLLTSKVNADSRTLTQIKAERGIYTGSVYQKVLAGESSHLMDLYKSFKVEESTEEFEEGYAFSKKYTSVNKDFKLGCSILDHSRTSKVKFVGCSFSVKQSPVNSYNVFFHEYTPKVLSVAFTGEFAKEIFNLFDLNTSFIDFNLEDKFEVNGGSSHLIMAIAE